MGGAQQSIRFGAERRGKVGGKNTEAPAPQAGALAKPRNSLSNLEGAAVA